MVLRCSALRDEFFEATFVFVANSLNACGGIAVRRGWPIEDEAVSTRLLLVAARIAEAKGARDVAFQQVGETPVSGSRAASVTDSDAISRIRAKMTEAEQIIAGLR